MYKPTHNTTFLQINRNRNSQGVISKLGLHTIIVNSTAPTAPPPNVMSKNTASRSVTLTWDEIICIECNGIITSYTVEFGLQGRPTLRTDIPGQTFTPNEQLKPFTNYTFRVAGANFAGTGVYSPIVIITTHEESKWAELKRVSELK